MAFVGQKRVRPGMLPFRLRDMRQPSTPSFVFLSQAMSYSVDGLL